MELDNPTWDQIIELVQKMPSLNPHIRDTFHIFTQMAQNYRVPSPWRVYSPDPRTLESSPGSSAQPKVQIFFPQGVYMAIRPAAFYVGQLVIRPRLDVRIEQTGTWHDVIVELKRLIGHADDYTLDYHLDIPWTSKDLASLIKK